METDADCSCTCCWYQYLQNYCYKRLCTDNEGFIRLYEYTKSICERSPARKNVRPYRPNERKSFGNPSDKIDLDKNEDEEDYYLEVAALGVDLFASNNDSVYRSLRDHEKDDFFIDLSFVFDLDSLTLPGAQVLNFVDQVLEEAETIVIPEPELLQNIPVVDSLIEDAGIDVAEGGTDDAGDVDDDDDDDDDDEDDNDEDGDEDDKEEDEDKVTDEEEEGENAQKGSPELLKRSKPKLSEEEFGEVVSALAEYKEELNIDDWWDIFRMYSNNADETFEIIKQTFGEAKFQEFLLAFEDSKQAFRASDYPIIRGRNGKVCSDSDGSDMENPFSAIGENKNLIFGCFLGTSVYWNDVCYTGVECKCRCAIGFSMHTCFQRYGAPKNVIDDIVQFKDLMCNVIEDDDPSTINQATESAVTGLVSAQAFRVSKILDGEKIDNNLKVLNNLKGVAAKLHISDELEELKNEMIFKGSIQAPSVVNSPETGSIGAQIILDKCELENNDLNDYLQFNIDSCDIRDLYYCKNHYKGNKCLDFEKDDNQCNNACCLEIKMAQCAKSHCLSKKPVKEFEKIANLICTKYADQHVTDAEPPFPEVEAADINKSGIELLALKNRRSNGEDGDEKTGKHVEDNIGESVCEIEEFEPGYDLTKCNKLEVKMCIKDGILNLFQDPEHFCPYCDNNNAYDECRCACCFAKYFSKVCYDPNCVILHEKLRYKRYVRETCKTRPVQYLFARDPKKQKSNVKELPQVEDTQKGRTKDNSKQTPSSDEYNDITKLKNSTKSSSQQDFVKGKGKPKEQFDMFSGFDDPVASEEIYVQSHPVNVNQDKLNKKKKNNLRYNFKLQSIGKRDSQHELAEEFEESAEEDHSNVLYHEVVENQKVRRDVPGDKSRKQSLARAKLFAKTGSMDRRPRKGGEKKSKIFASSDSKKQSAQAKDFGVPVKNNKIKKKMPNKPKKVKSANDYLVEGPKFLQDVIGKKDNYERDTPLSGDNSIQSFDSINEENAEASGADDKPEEVLNLKVGAQSKNQKLKNKKKSKPRSKSRSNTSKGSQSLKAPVSSKGFKAKNLDKSSSGKKKSVSSPKLSKRLEVYPRDTLYKRDSEINAIYDDIIEDNIPESTVPKDTSKFKTVTRTRTKTLKQEPSTSWSTATPTNDDGESQETRYGYIQFGVNALPLKSSGTNDHTFTTTIFTDKTSLITKTNYVTVTKGNPNQTTIFKTTTETETKSLTPSSSKIPIPPSTTKPPKKPPVTVTSIKTHVRPTTLTETEYEDFSTSTTTVYGDTLTETIPKRVYTKYRDTTTEYDTMDVTSTLVSTKIKTIPNTTVTEYEESDQTVTSVKTKNITVTATDYEDITTKVVTTFEGTLTTTVASVTTTEYSKSLVVTKTATETETEERVRTKWYPIKTVTDYEDEETIYKTKWYPTTTTDLITTTSTATTTTTTTTTASASSAAGGLLNGRIRPVPSVASPLKRKRDNEESQLDAMDSEDLPNIDDDLSNTPTKTVNGTTIDNITDDQSTFKSEGSKASFDKSLIPLGGLAFGALSICLYIYSNYMDMREIEFASHIPLLQSDEQTDTFVDAVDTAEPSNILNIIKEGDTSS